MTASRSARNPSTPEFSDALLSIPLSTFSILLSAADSPGNAPIPRVDGPGRHLADRIVQRTYFNYTSTKRSGTKKTGKRFPAEPELYKLISGCKNILMKTYVTFINF